MAWPNLPYGPGPGQWDTIYELLRSAANYDFANGQKMTIKGTVCGNVANANSIDGNGNYSLTGTVGGTQWVGVLGPIHSTYDSQKFNCQWYTTTSGPPPGCVFDPKNEPSDQLFVDIAIASNTAKALPATQTFANVDTNGGDVTIFVNSGLNVINIPGQLQIRGGNDLIISGPSDAVVIFNVGSDDEVNTVSGGMDIQNGSSVLITGGVQAKNILFNVLAGDVTVNAGVVNGNILVRAGSDVKGKIDIQGTSWINGIAIGDGNHSSEFSLADGAKICRVSIDIEKFVWDGTNWVDADTPPGPSIPQGTNPQYRFVVTNTGEATLTNITVTDNVLMNIGTISSLAPGASQTLTAAGTWALGLHTNTATASTTYNGQTISDSDPANYTGVPAVPALDIEKYVFDGTNWVDADNPPGPSIPQGTNPQFRYVVTNTGNVTLTNVLVKDDVLGTITTIASLAPGASQTFNATGTWALGLQTNIGTASTTYNGQPISDSDPANYTGVPVSAPAIDIEKYVWDGTTWVDADNPPGPNVPSNTSPQFRYVVTNTGNVTLTNINVLDNKLGPIATVPSLAPGASQTFTASGTWALGLQTNIATASTTYNGQTISDSDPANYTGVRVTGPSIDIEKYVWDGTQWVDADNPPGPSIQQGTNPQYLFVVTNTGTVTLTNVLVKDDVLGTITTIASLAPGASQSFTASGTWDLGLQTNIGTASTTYNGQPVSDSDPANYTGVPVPAPAIDIEKYVWDGTDWVDADNPPGPSLQQGTNPLYRFVVTNTGNVTLTNVQVTDDVLGPIGTILSLAPGASQNFNASGTWDLGLQTNIGTASTTYNGQLISDTDPANYTGVPVEVPALDIEKYVWDGTNWVDADNPPGPNIPQGTNPQFRYVVTNIGNVTLTNVLVKDDVLGTITTIASLAPGAPQTFNATGTWAAGLQTNIATASTTYNGQQISDSDPANYTGIPTPRPAINITKYVWDGTTWVDANNPPGPSIPEGTAPQFRIVVTNTGNVTLTNVAVTDNKLGPIATIPSLAPGASQTYIVTGTWAAGQQVNTATASTTYNGQPVTDSDQAHYFGTIVPTPGITVKKLISPDGGKTFVDAETAPGPVIPQGTNPIFRFIVTNTGNVTLTNITLTDTVFGTITVPSTLAPGLSFTIERTGVWSPCEHMNVATVTGKYGTATVTDSDQAHYVGLPNATMFKQFSVQEDVSIPSQKPTAEDILDANVSVVITDVHPIKTSKGTSYEGQVMTGWKLIVEGKLVQNVVYIANDHSQSVHAAEFEMPFSTFIILPEDFKQCTPLHVEGFVEDVYVKLIDGRRIFKNITLRIEAKSKC